MSSCSDLWLECQPRVQYWCLLKCLSQRDPNVPMSEIIPPDSNDLSWWTQSPSGTRNVPIPYMEDEREEEENFWAQLFGGALCPLKQFHIVDSKVIIDISQGVRNVSSRRRETELGEEIVLRWRIFCLSDLNHNVSCTIYQYAELEIIVVLRWV